MSIPRNAISKTKSNCKKERLYKQMIRNGYSCHHSAAIIFGLVIFATGFLANREISVVFALVVPYYLATNSKRYKSRDFLSRCSTPLLVDSTTTGNTSNHSPLSMGIDELSIILNGRGRALAAWDCYRQGIDPCLFYSSSFVQEENAFTAKFPKNRENQGLGKDSLQRLKNAFPHNPQQGIIEHCVASLSHSSTSNDGTTKLLIKMAKDGLEVETVIIPWEKRKRSTLCISSQVGCRQGCTFCATGRMGKLRSLSSDEIIVQMYYATQLCRSPNSNLFPIDNVVFMGMGEPADNADNVVRACRILTDRQLFQLSRSKVTISTVAPTPKAFSDLAAAQCTLAWSVHVVNDETRQFLIPTFNPKIYTVQQMKVELCRVLNSSHLSSKRLRTIMLEVALLDGVNDAVHNAVDLAEFAQSMMDQVQGLKLVVNLIPWNDIGTGSRSYNTPKPSAVKDFQNALTERGIYTFIRTTRGDDDSAACGQLATTRLPIASKAKVEK